MKTTTVFEMVVSEVFHFSDGRTVFAGEINEDALGHIGKSKCELLVDGTEIDRFVIEGEMLSTPNRTNLRSVSVNKTVSITSDEVKRRQHVLVSVDE